MMSAVQLHADAILVINSGSSSLKVGQFVHSGPESADERPLLLASATGIGQAEGKLSVTDGDGHSLPGTDSTHDYKSQSEALAAIAERLAAEHGASPVAIGHRIVHGGVHLTAHQKITPAVLKTLEQAVHFAPLHIPGSLELIKQTEKLYPGVPQFACFDTAFHQTLPEQAWRLPIPAKYSEAGVRRYGFHGLSYESIVYQLRAEGEIPRRLIVAHLGSGSSLAAIREGKSIDTTMGLTPTGGIPMATRTGDIDPGVLIYLARTAGLSTDELEHLVNQDCGLNAISDGLSDMQKLEQAGTRPAELAVEIFAVAVAKAIAALSVSLEGLDLLVFTGGIGEHGAPFRAQVMERLAWLGLALDPKANGGHSSGISAPGSKAAVRVLPAQEDLQIARHCRRLLSSDRGD
jgi:acetate kinase